MKRLKDKVAVVTGGNSGIGLATAKLFVAEGAKVVVSGRTVSQELVQQELGENAVAVKCDIANLEDIEKLYIEAHKEFGGIDIIVANAGMGEQKNLSKVDEEYFDQIIDVNLKGTFFTIRYGLDYLKDGAVIVIVSSIAGHLGIGNTSVYSAAKAGLLAMARNFSMDLLSRKIRVNTISPGLIMTPIWDEALKNEPDMVNKLTRDIPCQRFGTSDEVGQLILFLTSDESKYIIGQDITIDGGLTSLATHLKP